MLDLHAEHLCRAGERDLDGAVNLREDDHVDEAVAKVHVAADGALLDVGGVVDVLDFEAQLDRYRVRGGGGRVRLLIGFNLIRTPRNTLSEHF